MAIITISRQFGAGGHTLGQRLAKELGYRYLDREIIEEVARRAGVSTEQAESVEEYQGSSLTRLIDRMVKLDYLARLKSDQSAYLTDRRYTELVSQVLNEVADQGEVVVVGRSSQFILRDREGFLAFKLVAPLDFRLSMVQKRFGLDQQAAGDMIRRQEEHHNRCVQAYAPGGQDDPTHYHLTINTAWTGLDRAREIMIGMV